VGSLKYTKVVSPTKMRQGMKKFTLKEEEYVLTLRLSQRLEVSERRWLSKLARRSWVAALIWQKWVSLFV